MLVCTDKIRECHNLGDQNVKVISCFLLWEHSCHTRLEPSYATFKNDLVLLYSSLQDINTNQKVLHFKIPICNRVCTDLCVDDMAVFYVLRYRISEVLILFLL
jgi:hypothetical protein